MCNPEPVADFFDAVVIGDGEEVILKMTDTWLEWKRGGANGKERLLKRWDDIEGVYVPSFYDAEYDDNGFQTLRPVKTGKQFIKRAVVANLDKAPFPVSPLIPFGRPVHDRLRLEHFPILGSNSSEIDGFYGVKPLKTISGEAKKRAEKNAIEKALIETNWNRVKAAKLLEVDYKTLRRKMKELDIYPHYNDERSE